MTEKEEYDALKKCLSELGRPCESCPCGGMECIPENMISRLLPLHGEMVAREIYKEATSERTLYGVSPLSEAEMLDIARNINK